MNESWDAQGLLNYYMDARWKRDTLEAILIRFYSAKDGEAKHLICADLLYLHPEKYKRIVGGVESEVAIRQISDEFALEVRRMENLRQKLMMHDLVEVETMGQMKTVAQLKREYGWDVEVVIECDRDEVRRQMQEVANNSLIPIQEANIKPPFKPDLPQKPFVDDRRAPQDKYVPPWLRDLRSGMRVDAPVNIAEPMEEDDEDIDWEEG